MLRFVNYLVHFLAAIALYIILVVGLGWFWTIGTSDNYERINDVLINLSYSFITGYLVYLCTVFFPARMRSKKVSIIVAEKMQRLVDSRIIPCLRVFVPILKHNDSYSDQELVSLYESGNLLSQVPMPWLNQPQSVIDNIRICNDDVKNEIDGIIDKYGHDLSVDLLKRLEEIKKKPGLENGISYSTLIRVRQAYNIQNGNTTPEENRKIAEDYIALKKDMLFIIESLKK